VHSRRSFMEGMAALGIVTTAGMIKTQVETREPIPLPENIVSTTTIDARGMPGEEYQGTVEELFVLDLKLVFLTAMEVSGVDSEVLEIDFFTASEYEEKLVQHFKKWPPVQVEDKHRRIAVLNLNPTHPYPILADVLKAEWSNRHRHTVPDKNIFTMHLEYMEGEA